MGGKFMVIQTGWRSAALLSGLAGLLVPVAPVRAQEYDQAPMLDAQVEAGELPPVAERLPAEPYVEEMIDGVGEYGGTLRTTILANGDHYNLTRTVANELLVRWDPRWTTRRQRLRNCAATCRGSPRRRPSSTASWPSTRC